MGRKRLATGGMEEEGEGEGWRESGRGRERREKGELRPEKYGHAREGRREGRRKKPEANTREHVERSATTWHGLEITCTGWR